MFKTLSYYIQTVYRWILRCGYSRGFGIQSPSAYSFVRYIINEHYPYYAYQGLDAEMKMQTPMFRKIGRLLFRMANYWQPQYVVMGDYDFAPYAYAGCHNTLVRMIDDYYFEDIVSPVLVVLDMDWLDDDSLREDILGSATSQVLLVCIGIHANTKNKRLWRRMIADERTGVTYDLYSCGIVFFDKSKHKQDFKINF